MFLDQTKIDTKVEKKLNKFVKPLSLCIFSALSLKEKEGLETRKKLGEFEFGDVLEVTSLEIVNGKEGSYGVGQYSLSRKKGRRDTGKVTIPARLVDGGEARVPFVLVYLGPKTSAGGMVYHNTRTFPCDTVKDMKKKAANLREQDLTKLEEMLTVKSMSHFPQGAVLLLKTMQSRETRKEGFPALTWVATYEWMVDDENPNDEGEVYLPERMVDPIRARIPLSICYIGLQTASNGHKWHDMRLLDSDGDYRSLSTRDANVNEQTMEAWDSADDLIASM